MAAERTAASGRAAAMRLGARALAAFCVALSVAACGGLDRGSKEDGEPCTRGTECASGVCSGGVCRPRPDAGGDGAPDDALAPRAAE